MEDCVKDRDGFSLRAEAWWKENFGRLDTLKVSPLDTVADGLAIYGNGQHMASLVITVKILDKGGQVIVLDEDELETMLSLCHYQAGGDIPAGWWAQTTASDFTKPLHASIRSVALDSKAGDQMRIYVATNGAPSATTLSAVLTIPGIGAFNTSRQPTDTPNGVGGGPFRNESYVSLRSVLPIDYGRPDALNVVGAPSSHGDLEEVVGDIHVSVSGVKPDFYGGESGRGNIRIYPKGPASLFVRKRVRGNDAPLARFEIWRGGQPAKADIVLGVGGGNFDATLVLVEAPGMVGVRRGAFALTGERSSYTWTYDLGDNDYRHVVENSITDKYIDVRLFNHRVPRRNLVKDTWWDAAKPVTVEVTDDYGNEGTITLEMSALYWPKVRINGQLDWPR